MGRRPKNYNTRWPIAEGWEIGVVDANNYGVWRKGESQDRYFSSWYSAFEYIHDKLISSKRDFADIISAILASQSAAKHYSDELKNAKG